MSPDPDGGADAAVLDLLGLAAYVELATFGLLAGCSVDAPDLSARQTLAEAAGRALHRQQALLALGTERGASPGELMGPYDGALADFDARTQPGSWWEGLLKGAVGHAVATDLCATLARGLPDGDRAVVGGVLEDGTRADAVMALLTEAASRDERLASRLALWGRRVAGEALSLVQTVLVHRPSLAALALAADRTLVEPAAGPRRSDVPAWLLSHLTAEHTRRMDRIGLAA